MAIIGILTALLLPVISQGQARAKRIECVNNLNEIGIAFHSFAHDHDSRFPMQVPMSQGGSSEYVANGLRIRGDFYFAFRHLQALSQQLGAPKILICPADTRQAAVSFAALKNENVSYFVGVTAEFDKPESVLSGDRNLTNDWGAGTTILREGPGVLPLRWTQALHRFKGNLLFADGHVEERNDLHLTPSGTRVTQLQDFFLPTAQPATGGAKPAANELPNVGLPPAKNATASLPEAGTNEPSQPNRQVSSTSRGLEAHLTFASPNPAEPSPTEPKAIPTSTNAPPQTHAKAQTTPAPTTSPFMLWFADMARQLGGAAGWLMLLLLLLLAAALLAFRLWQRPKRK